MTSRWKRWARRMVGRDADHAMRHANERVAEAEARAPEVAELVESVERQGDSNHFIDRLNLHVRRHA